jgi:hypothetical protein
MPLAHPPTSRFRVSNEHDPTGSWCTCRSYAASSLRRSATGGRGERMPAIALEHLAPFCRAARSLGNGHADV